MVRVVVLLKHGTLQAVECPQEDVFLLARARNAGICGVFESRTSAEAFIGSIYQPTPLPLQGWEDARQE